MRDHPEAGWRGAWVIARRDLLEFVRDRRTLFITLLMPLITYPMLALSSTLGVRTAIRELEGSESVPQLRIAYSGSDAAAWVRRVDDLQKAGARWPGRIVPLMMPTEDLARQLIDTGQADAWIDLPAGTLTALDAARTVPIVVQLSDRRPPGPAVRGLVRSVLDGVAEDARRRRLDRAGLPPTLLEPLAVEFRGGGVAATAAVRKVMPAVVGGGLVLFAMLMATGAYYPASDAIAGEKERGTIETLLIAPCTTGQLVLGKFLAVFGVTLATLAVNATSIALTSSVLLRLTPAGVGIFSPRAAAACAAVTLVAYTGLAAVSAALCLAITSASKSVKEAHNTLSPVVMLVAALAGSALLPGTDGLAWLPAIPFAGQVAVAKQAFVVAENGGGTGTSVAVGLAVSLASSALLTTLCLRLTAMMLADEEIIFRGPDVPRGLARPAPRRLPTPTQALGLAFASFALLWYAQGVGGTDIGGGLIALQALTLMAPLAVLAWWQRTDAAATYSLRTPGAGAMSATAGLIGAALVGCGLFVIGASAFVTFVGTDVSEQVRALGTQLVSLVRGTAPWISLLLLAVMPACCEELVFRGWILAGLAGERPSRGRAAVAVVVQAAVFALFHLLPERMPQTFTLGIVLGWMTLATRSLLPAVVAHVTHNATPVIMLRALPADASPLLPAGAGSVPPWAVAAAVGCVLVGAALLAIARSRTPEGA